MRAWPFLLWKNLRTAALLCLPSAALVTVATTRAQSPEPQGPARATVQLDAASRAEVAEKFARALASEYVYADQGAKMAAAIRAKVNVKAYDSITSPSEFANALERDARAVVDDRHLEVDFSSEPALMPQGGPSREMMAEMRQQHAGIPQVKILDGNIGYIVANGMLPDSLAKDPIAAAFAFLRDTDALILDLRGNPGGSGSIDLYMSYLSTSTPHLLHSVHWRNGRVAETKTMDLGVLSYGAKKSVFLLTSHRTFSAAEAFAYDFQSCKRGMIVGETTGGGANPSALGGMAPLGHGFFANIPAGYVVNAVTGGNWEGVGVKPDIKVPADEALAKAWSLALVRLSANATDPQTRTFFEALSSAKLDGEPTLSSAQLVGQYAAKSGDPTMLITQNDGKLYGHESYADGEVADIAFRSLGGDRYAPVGFPDGFSLTFAQRDGKVELVQVRPPPMDSSLLQKQ
ncbi:MAG TPA: S41 family peptidase [Candidatus Acidoferrum sp.]|nr:S41 family peptidase [Candidatus Acidoferrum sp.]